MSWDIVAYYVVLCTRSTSTFATFSYLVLLQYSEYSGVLYKVNYRHKIWYTASNEYSTGSLVIMRELARGTTDCVHNRQHDCCNAARNTTVLGGNKPDTR